MVDLYVPQTWPSGIIDTTKDERQPIDYFEPLVAPHQQPLELMHLHLMAGRKLGMGGLCMPEIVGPGVETPFPLSIHLEAYTKFARVSFLYAFAGLKGYGTALLTSDSDGTGVSVELQHTPSLTAPDAVLASLTIQVGLGTDADLRAQEELELTITNDFAGAGNNVVLFGLGIQPLTPEIISV